MLNLQGSEASVRIQGFFTLFQMNCRSICWCLALTLHPHPCSDRTQLKSCSSSVPSLLFTCPHQELLLCSTKLKKFLIKTQHLKDTGWETLKIIGLHSWIKNINKTEKVPWCSSTNSSCAALSECYNLL